ncbi:hypothetical protein EST38_g3337 [Candolleomyces aberdarensis]|uniref:Uncharacterized protein n=1 Tax=Candolleomyces aberdarensis TaxID=2316362 RepID=A0A4Q2DTT3_9AGAR|nr:hypothetical protein EST38_g3337 [Candolleomyces aberdarensis]
MAFIPTQHWYKTYNLPPIRTLGILPTIYYSTTPGSQGFHIDPEDPFRLFEDDIYRAVAALRNKFELPCVLPFLPKTLGYLAFYKKKAELLHALEEAREWFSVWLGALSYCLAMAQTRREDTMEFKFGYPDWRQVLIDAGLSESWIDDIVRSPVGQLVLARPRVGCVLELVGRHQDQPDPDWFIANGIPIWYKWETEETDWVRCHNLVGWGPRRGTVKPVANKPWAKEDADSARVEHGTDEADQGGGRLPDSDWVKFFKDREARYPHIMATESPIARQRRENRTRDPPTRSAPVFEWWPKSDDLLKWERVPAPAKYRVDTLNNYARHQRRYDPFFNEWDCSEEFNIENGYVVDGDSDSDDDSDGDEGPKARFPVPKAATRSIASQQSEEQAPFDPAPDLFRPPSPPASNRSDTSPTSSEPPFDPIQAEVEDVFGRFYGFCPPALSTEFPDLSITDNSTDAFLRLLGLVREGLTTEPYFTSHHYQVARLFLDSAIGIKSPAPSLSDLDDSSLSPVRMLPRFKNVARLDLQSQPGNSACLDSGNVLYVFRLPQPSVPWQLATFSPITALFICRLPPHYTETAIAFHLVQRGMPFRVLHPPPRIRKPLAAPLTFKIPIRRWDHQFTKEDYESYVHNRTMILGQPHMQAALRRGGIAWRLAIGVMGISDVVKGPTLWGQTFLPGTNFVEDTASTIELDLICGAYECITADGTKRALKSWWPLVRYYEKPECGENHGHWSDRREVWYQERLRNISTSKAQPLSYTQWKTQLHGVKAIRSFLNHISKSSANLIATHSSATP